MPFNAFVVYETVGRKVRALKQAQAAADATAAADADLSAHMGTVAVPDNVIPGWYFAPADLSFTADPVYTGLDLLKSKARFTHNRMIGWSYELNAHALTHSSAHVNYGHDILFHGHEAMYIVLHRVAGYQGIMADEIRTIAQRIEYCEMMALGALDVTTVAQFFEHVHTVADTALTGPVTWVHPVSNVRLLFDTIPGTTMSHFPHGDVGEEDHPPGPELLRDGDWIEDLAT